MNTKWIHKDTWQQRGKDFCVEVVRWSVDIPESLRASDADGGQRWAVYGYVYPDHPLFIQFTEGEEMWQPATAKMPLHGGCSMVRRHKNALGKDCSIQFGADYNHLGDDEYTRMATADCARSVFMDAEALIAALSSEVTV